MEDRGPAKSKGAKEAAVAERLFSKLNLPEVRVPRGTFWADHLKAVRDEPPKRLALSFQALPLPGAFREAAVAVRAMIRAQRSAEQPVNYLLEELYRLAVLDDLLLSSPCSEEVGGALNVAESIDRRRWESLNAPYKAIGYTELGLLNKTDVRWMVAAWGEPDSHTTAYANHEVFWQEAVVEARRMQEREKERREREFRKLIGSVSGPASASEKSGKSPASGCVMIFGQILLITVIGWATPSALRKTDASAASSNDKAISLSLHARQ